MHRVISIRKQGWNWISNQEDLNCVDVNGIINVRKQKQSVDKQSQDFLKSAHILDADEVPSLIKQEFGGQSLNSSFTHHMSSDVDYVQRSSCCNDNVVRILFQTRVRILRVHGYSNETRVLLQRRHELIIWKGELVIRWIVKLYQSGNNPIHNVSIEKRRKFSILLLESLGFDHPFSELFQFLDLGNLEGVFPSSLSSVIHGIYP